MEPLNEHRYRYGANLDEGMVVLLPDNTRYLIQDVYPLDFVTDNTTEVRYLATNLDTGRLEDLDLDEEARVQVERVVTW